VNGIPNLRRWAYPLGLSAAGLLIFTPLIFELAHYKAGEVTSDFPAMIEFAQNLEAGSGDVPGYAVAHSLWEFLVIALNNAFGISFRMGAYLVTVSCIVAAALVLFFWFRPTLRANRLSEGWGVVAALGLSLVTPLSILAPIDRLFFAGYIGTIQYNNPTIILLRPFAFLQYILAIRCFHARVSTWRWTGMAAAVTLLATFAKPSFAVCFLPAIALLAAYRVWKKQPVDWRLLIAGFIVPAVAVLVWQFFVTYGSPDQSGIFLYPFGVMRDKSRFLLLKFLLSTLFPLLVAVLYFREASRDIRLLMAWLSFFWGLLFGYFIAEGPPRTSDGNFIWGARITLLVLFSASTVFILERIRMTRWKVLLAGAAWLAHVAYGVVYYFHYLNTGKHI